MAVECEAERRDAAKRIRVVLIDPESDWNRVANDRKANVGIPSRNVIRRHRSRLIKESRRVEVGAIEILTGAGKTGPVRADTIPGSLWRYSGGGYVVAQILMEDVTGRPFGALIERSVLNPLGMYRSTYAQPLPERLAGDAAVAHQSDGTLMPGRWHVYPEQAAAGLWATPTDLARFAVGLTAAYRGDVGAILSQKMAREMLSEQMAGWGLGLSVAGSGDSLRFSHGGSNAGYQSFMVQYPHTGDGAVVMTNSDPGYNLLMEVLRSISSVYGWPDFRPEIRTVVDVAPATLSAYVGEYEVSPEYVINISLEGEQLFAAGTGEEEVPLKALSETEFFPDGSAVRITFERCGRQGLLRSVLRTLRPVRTSRICRRLFQH